MPLASALLSHPRQTLSPFRLRRHADFQRVYAASRKHHSSSIAYFLRLRTPEEAPLCGLYPRIGLTVPKALGNAVVRNRIKRRMREALRLHLDLLHASPAPHIDLVLHPRSSVAVMDFPALERELAKLLAQVARLAPHPQPPPTPRPPRRARKSPKAQPPAGRS